VQQPPETRATLIARLKNAADHEAWLEFTAIYEPLVLRLALGQGLQLADAQDVCQQVLIAVAQDVERFRPDGQAASFRRWLFGIARNRVLKLLARESKKRGPGGSEFQAAVQAVAGRGESLTVAFDREYRQQLLLEVAAEIRSEFKEVTWQAFWRTWILGEPIPQVAAELKMSLGNVYVARSRIIARLRERVQAIEGTHDSP
jgi:RNA polymerase sigma-70 factor, ECF subfamily